MSIEKGMVIGSCEPAVDVTSLTPPTAYEILKKMGPDYVLTGRVGFVIRRVVIEETGDALVVVREQQSVDGEFEVRPRLSMAVIRRPDELVPRPAFSPVLPGVRP